MKVFGKLIITKYVFLQPCMELTFVPGHLFDEYRIDLVSNGLAFNLRPSPRAVGKYQSGAKNELIY